MIEIALAIVAIVVVFLFGQRTGKKSEQTKQQERHDATLGKIRDAQEVSDGLTEHDGILDSLRRHAKR